MDGVSAERDELRRLVEELPDAEVLAAVAELQLRVARPADRPWPPPWFGAAEGSRTDTAVRTEELLQDGFGRPA
jgi:hypothetical protein